MKVKNLVFSCVTVGLLALIFGLFAQFYDLLNGLAMLPEILQYPDAWPEALLVLLFLFTIVFAGLMVIFSVIGICCDCGSIKSLKTSKAMKIVTLVLSCFVLLFILGGAVFFLGLYSVLIWQYIINALIAIAVLVIASINVATVGKTVAKTKVQPEAQPETQPEAQPEAQEKE